MDEQTLKTLRTQMEDERKDLVTQLEDLGVSPETGAPSEASFEQGFADSGQATAEKARLLSLAEGLIELVREIDDAFERMEADTFGKCVTCGNEIPAERLEIRPYARECMTCAQR